MGSLEGCRDNKSQLVSAGKKYLLQLQRRSYAFIGKRLTAFFDVIKCILNHNIFVDREYKPQLVIPDQATSILLNPGIFSSIPLGVARSPYKAKWDGLTLCIYSCISVNFATEQFAFVSCHIYFVEPETLLANGIHLFFVMAHFANQFSLSVTAKLMTET